MSIRMIIGTGGIGSGVIFHLNSNRALGRNESRLARRLDQRDYCKLHIILHYLAVLARDLRLGTQVVPIGGVGRDPSGRELVAEMKDAGMCMDHVEQFEDVPTLLAACYQFPDGSGGNLSDAVSACSKINPSRIARAAKAAVMPRGQTMVLAAPEVSLASRLKLLRIGRQRNAFNVASFVPEEIGELRTRKILPLVDLLALNIDEAARLGRAGGKATSEVIVTKCLKACTRENPRLLVVITDGAKGAYGWDGDARSFLPAFRVRARNTAGAGDAFLSGVMLGTMLGLSFSGPSGATCMNLGRCVAAMKVASPHTISFDIGLSSLKAFAERRKQGSLARRLVRRR